MSQHHTTAGPIPWFRLDRHTDTAAEEAPTSSVAEPDTEPAADDAGEQAEAEQLLADAVDGGGGSEETGGSDGEEQAPELGDRGKRALDRMKSERAAARKEAVEAKRQLAALNKRVQEFEDRDKSDLDKATAKAERLAEQATRATARAVNSEIKALAAGRFADATDATDALMRHVEKYVDDGGEIDTDAIQADLGDLLERKPHWAVPAPSAAASEEPARPAKARPKPDPGQGSRPGPKDPDFRSASKDEVAAELAKYGYRQRAW